MFDYRPDVVWILMLLLQLVQGMGKTSDPLTDLGMHPMDLISHVFTGSVASADIIIHFNVTENIAGRLVFYQMDGNATYVRDTGELASDVPTETMFELFDPQRNFSEAKFTYTWDLGNG